MGYCARDSIDEGMRGEKSGGVKRVAEQIEEIGAESCIISTDFGVNTLPTQVEGLREFITCLLDLGLSENEVSTLVKTNPERLLNIT
jgi:microsomal dipeptidase-like Zn-dependent dipeptidase